MGSCVNCVAVDALIVLATLFAALLAAGPNKVKFDCVEETGNSQINFV